MALADPLRCPDCRAPIVAGQPSCPTCELPLRGDRAAALFAVLQSADRLIAELRAPAALPGPADAEPAAGPSRRPRPVAGSARLSAASVPTLLLALGAGCLLVAALVFLAVSWTVMGVAGRTATLVVLTAVAAVLAGWLARRDLRGGAEALSLVALGLLGLDIVGADNAGWLGDLGPGGFLTVLGTGLAVAGTLAALAARLTPIASLLAGELGGGVGVAVAAVGVGTAWPSNDAAAAVAATLLAATGTVVAVRLRLPRTALWDAGVTAVAWLVLVGRGLDAVAGHAHLQGLWLDGRVWPLLAAVVLALAGAALRPAPRPVRVAAAGAAYVALLAALTAAAFDESATTRQLCVVLVLLLTAGAGRALPVQWRPAVVPAQLLGLLLMLSLALDPTARAVDRLAELTSSRGSGWTDRLPAFAPGVDLAAPWLLPVAVLAAALTLASLAGRTLPAAVAADLVPRRGGPSAPTVTVLVATAVLVACLLALALTSAPVWTLAAGFVAAAGGMVAWGLRPVSEVALLPGVLLLTGGTAVAGHAEPLLAGTLSCGVLLALVAHLRARRPGVSAAAGTLTAVALAAALWTWAEVTGVREPVAALVVLLVAAAAVLLLPLLPAGAWHHSRPGTARAGFEAGGAIGATATSAAGVLSLPVAAQAEWTALLLTVAGAATTALALLRPDRRVLLPVGGLLLAAATWVRLWDLGVRAPEPYTLPAALALAVAGGLHLRRHPDAATPAALGPALALGLVPTLLWAVAEDSGARAVLLGAACLTLVLLGARLGWTAPLVWGAAVGAALVVRLAAPYIGDAVPRWVLIGTAGALLIAAGVTWERRTAEARQALGYVRALR